jgi:hypothetical protein
VDSRYRLRTGESADGERLERFHDTVFSEEAVGFFARTLFGCFPGLEHKNWYIVEERETGDIAASLVLIPWALKYGGVRLNVAEMGIVGTAPAHRKRGLQTALNDAFDRRLLEGGFDLAMIQGIPGFYDHFGYQYSLPLDYHLNLPLHLIPEPTESDREVAIEIDSGAGDRSSDRSRWRRATSEDIPWLLEEDAKYRAGFDIAAIRSADHWRYLLGPGVRTSCGSDLVILQTREERDAYLRIQYEGFGTGLIVSEISEDVSVGEFRLLLSLCRKLAVERGKPYIRFNVHHESNPGRLATAFGSTIARRYAWQMKIPDKRRFIEILAPVLEARIESSAFRGLTGILKIDLYRERLFIIFRQGSVVTISREPPREPPSPPEAVADIDTYSCAIRESCFAPIVLGHRSIDEFGYLFSDTSSVGSSRALTDVLFPKTRNWIHEQY